jgi:hypothetical protein
MKSTAYIKPFALTAASCAFLIAPPSYAGNACEVKSGAATAALVELYTSEGCSSCPPADKQLSRLRQQSDANAVIVPLALHVGYWDAIGWKDVFAQKAFDERQSQLLANRKNRVVYTPQFFVNGMELRNWQNDLPRQIRQTNAQVAPLTITLKSKPLADNKIAVSAEVAAHDAKTNGALYLAISESALTSRVLRGENSGVTLKHDDTVRLWYGPMPLVQGRGRMEQEVTIPAGWNRDNLQAVAFVQDQASGNVLQAVSTAQCKQTRG